MEEHGIDLRSDTLTKPTEEMLEAMGQARVGDDVYGEDPTVNALELLAAEKVGKEAALFVPSGTMGNLIAVLAHTDRGDEIILEAGSHIYTWEAGGMASMAGVMSSLVKGDKGIMAVKDIENAIRPEDIHYPRTRLICVENSHNKCGGTVVGPGHLAQIKTLADRHNLAIHMDGARVFNAAIALGVDVKELTGSVDSVMFCVSKGLSAPVGSLLAGTAPFIQKARKFRKVLGGGMRQAGYLAAAAIIAIEKMVDRLAEDHRNARLLAEGLAEVPGLQVDLSSVQTNIVNVDFSLLGLEADRAVALLAERGVKVNGRAPHTVRMVTHRHISSGDVEDVIASVRKIAG